MKTLVKTTVSIVLVISVILLVTNYISSQPELSDLVEGCVDGFESVKNVLKNTADGLITLAKFVIDTILSFAKGS